MKLLYNFLLAKRIRLGQWLSLIFFVCLLAEGCRQKTADISIVWNGVNAVGIAIPKQLLSDELAEPPTGLQVRLKGNTDAMLGNYENRDDHILFKPVIPLSPGDEYEVLYKNKQVGMVPVPGIDATTAAYISNVSPAADTVPMNLLKIYIHFSAPMRQGEALRHIHLLNEQRDTMPNVFLDLQPELWDESRMNLTVWLDPGRIKRDLIPNQQWGNPLQPGRRYSMVISNAWKDARGLPLRQPFSKTFVAGARDSVSPQPEQWKLNLPAAHTTGELSIYFGESLDYFLVSETIHILDEQGKVITGNSRPLNNGTGYTFRPEAPWQPGKYALRIAVELEDLAGNNLNRLFERDLQVKATETDRDFVERTFVLQ